MLIKTVPLSVTVAMPSGTKVDSALRTIGRVRCHFFDFNVIFFFNKYLYEKYLRGLWWSTGEVTFSGFLSSDECGPFGRDVFNYHPFKWFRGSTCDEGSHPTMQFFYTLRVIVHPTIVFFVWVGTSFCVFGIRATPPFLLEMADTVCSCPFTMTRVSSLVVAQLTSWSTGLQVERPPPPAAWDFVGFKSCSYSHGQQGVPTICSFTILVAMSECSPSVSTIPFLEVSMVVMSSETT